VEKLSEIFHRRMKYHLIVRARIYLENRNSNELTNDLGINSDSTPSNSGLKHQPSIIILYHFKVGIEESDQPSVNNKSVAVKISPMICLDSVMDTIQRSHHNVEMDHILLSNNRSVHDLSSEGCSIFLCPPINIELWTVCRHGSVKETNKICQK